MELLAPAGSKEALVAAVQNGADAVYLAGQQFGARHSAQNFSNEELKEAVDYAHVYGVKIYVTVNTQIKENEYQSALAFVAYLYEIGVDAILVQDTALGYLVKQQFPTFHVHASTQMSIHDVTGALFLQNLGFDRVVLARELSYREIQNIRVQTTIELEVFAHGALCMCYSGQCYMSSFMGGRSGNRGRCAQPCRLNYRMYEGDKMIKEGHLLSPKDLSLAKHLKTMDKDAFHSLKIEGRLKSPLYVALVCHVFRDCLDHNTQLSSENEALLTEAFCRSGFTDGYFTSHLGADMMSYETPTNTAFYSKASAETKKTQEELSHTFAEGAPPVKRMPISMSFVWQENEPLCLMVENARGFMASAQSDKVVEKALRSPMDFDRVAEQLKKTGNTPFGVNDVSAQVWQDGLCISIKEINNVRRMALEKLEAEIAKSFHRAPKNLTGEKLANGRAATVPELVAEVTTKEQLAVALKYPFARIYVPSNLWDSSAKFPDNVVLKCPDIVAENLPQTDKKLVGNLGYLQTNAPQNCYGDFRLGVFNSQSVHFYEKLGLLSLTLSIELSTGEMRHIIEKTTMPLEAIVYGKLPLMVMKNCPFRAVKGKCPSDCMNMHLKDRRGETISHTCDHKICTIINAKPLYVADNWDKFVPEDLAAVRLWFTDESAALCEKIIAEYEKAIMGQKARNVFGENEFTRGHFGKGVL